MLSSIIILLRKRNEVFRFPRFSKCFLFFAFNVDLQ
nr:MAG TPA: hypothetical protein [Caudoviricetes sp.]